MNTFTFISLHFAADYLYFYSTAFVKKHSLLLDVYHLRYHEIDTQIEPVRFNYSHILQMLFSRVTYICQLLVP